MWIFSPQFTVLHLIFFWVCYRGNKHVFWPNITQSPIKQPFLKMNCMKFSSQNCLWLLIDIKIFKYLGTCVFSSAPLISIPCKHQTNISESACAAKHHLRAELIQAQAECKRQFLHNTRCGPKWNEWKVNVFWGRCSQANPPPFFCFLFFWEG